MTQLIQVPAIGQTPQIAINPEGEALKNELIAMARGIMCVIDDGSRDNAIVRAGSIKAHLAAVEKERVAIKEPFLTAGRMIDAAAKAHVTELDCELRRLNNLNGAYEVEKQRKLQAEERARQAEQDRLAREAEKARLEALRLQEEADKKAAALAAKGKEPTDSQKAKNLEAQLEADERAETARAQAEQIEKDRQAAAIQRIESKPTGGSLIEDFDIGITDIHALYRDCQQAVRMEPDVVFLKGMARRGVKYAGVIYTPRAEFRARAAK